MSQISVTGVKARVTNPLYFRGLGVVSGEASIIKATAGNPVPRTLEKGAPNFSFLLETTSRLQAHSNKADLMDLIFKKNSPNDDPSSPPTLYEFFCNPYISRDKSITQILIPIAEKLRQRMTDHLKERPLDDLGEEELKRKIINCSLPAYKIGMKRRSLDYGKKLVEGAWHKFEINDLSKPRVLIFEVLSLAKVGIRICEWIENVGRDREKDRIEAIAQLQVIIEMILDKEQEWQDLQRDNEAWTKIGKYVSAEEIKQASKGGRREFNGIELLGDERNKDLSGIRCRGAEFGFANLRGANLSGAVLKEADLFEADLEGANLQDADLRRALIFGTNFQAADVSNVKFDGAVINRKPLESFNTGKWREHKTILEKINAWFKEDGRISFVGEDLGGLDLSGVVMPDAILQGVKLRGTILVNAQLQSADLSSADLRQADFQGAKLIGVNFKKSNLEGVNFEKADLKGVDFSGQDLSRANLKRVRFEKANLRGALLRKARLQDARFLRTILEGADLKGARLWGALIDKCALLTLNTGEWEGDLTIKQRLNAWHARGGKIKFSHNDLRRSDLSGANLTDAQFGYIEFEGADLRGAKLKRAFLQYSDLSHTDLRGADLRCAEFIEGNFSGAQFDKKTKFKGAKIDPSSLATFDTGIWQGLSFKQKKELWISQGGKISQE